MKKINWKCIRITKITNMLELHSIGQKCHHFITRIQVRILKYGRKFSQ